MSECFLCGNGGGHHLGCAAAVFPGLTEEDAWRMGLIGPPKGIKKYEPEAVEVLVPGTMTTAPEEDIPAGGGETVEGCEFKGCESPKFSASPRAKYCADHKDPKNRKE